MEFGYSISQPRAVNIDRNDLSVADGVLTQTPSWGACIGCGACAATCTAAAHTDFSLRKVHTLVRRGEYAGAWEEMNKCMLCGKCRMVCPRGVNTRGLVMTIKRGLAWRNS